MPVAFVAQARFQDIADLVSCVGGGAVCLFQWNSWDTKFGADQAGPYALTLSDGLVIDGRVRFENGSGCDGTVKDFTVSGREAGKTYVINKRNPRWKARQG